MKSKIGFIIKTSIGKKFLMGLSGLFLVAFVVVHFLGNLLIFLGPEKYNSYSHLLISSPGIIFAEIIIILIFLTHVFLGIYLTFENYKAKPLVYKKSPSGEGKPSVFSKTMIYQGLIVFVFICFHLWSFKFGAYYEITSSEGKIRDIYRLVAESFNDTVIVVGYIFSVLILGFHLIHGVGSAFQSLGVSNFRFNVFLEYFSIIFAVIVIIGFVSPVLFLYFNFTS